MEGVSRAAFHGSPAPLSQRASAAIVATLVLAVAIVKVTLRNRGRVLKSPFTLFATTRLITVTKIAMNRSIQVIVLSFSLANHCVGARFSSSYCFTHLSLNGR
jgi:uncharacterized membrane protein